MGKPFGGAAQGPSAPPFNSCHPERSRGTLCFGGSMAAPASTRSFDSENGLASESVLSAQDDKFLNSDYFGKLEASGLSLWT